MSQGADVAVVVESLAELLRAAVEAGAEVVEERQRLRTTDGQSHEVDAVLRQGGAEVGVKVDPRSKQVVLVPRDCQAGPGQALAGRVVQRYAYSRVLQELKQKGYQVAREEKQRDGSVKLVFQRWR
ncbi:MAG: DUF1257 domain-containing protein [Deltaproteobacteria bacterium]|nr:DUF1257 domain-containing protein [Deltaproteobacteria bacterium]